ncbi:fragment of DNA-directed RNA polymerase subunit 1 [Acanthamoeba polyphaga moumouvirus]|uniref:Fragment of DNA-directed RNA polymerase subunit 1 n=1 Tax=Acanthamoeba polyphaga moumouvirus TaxID=1269028 RepID=L7RB25_9VIRU|nr:fragment of DNA-directed RNA polymerase subunit 1 [Acanthamoeba polyphaga moumouvirus]AGC01604.1 fragment of DNA-directed RNA polymerase subunit 1 [Acanthamoeba polyphaga moumouvirus]
MDTLYIEEIKDGKIHYKIIRSSHVLASRFKGHEGRIRNNLFGKKVDMLRSCISSDPIINEK